MAATEGQQPKPPLKLLEVPYEIQDPISHDVMWDPVLLVETGHSYDRSSIEQWFKRGNRTCPKTNRHLRSLMVSVSTLAGEACAAATLYLLHVVRVPPSSSLTGPVTSLCGRPTSCISHIPPA